MPGPPQYGGAPVTNIRNLDSAHWRGWLGRHNRCLVPATSFCEYADTKPRKTPIWFALDEDRPMFAFAGLWARWRGVRGPKGAPVEGEHQLFGFLTTEANATVVPIHPKAMPVILTTSDEFDRWLEGDTLDALNLQRPLPDDTLRIVAKGEKRGRRLNLASMPLGEALGGEDRAGATPLARPDLVLLGPDGSRTGSAALGGAATHSPPQEATIFTLIGRFSSISRAWSNDTVKSSFSSAQ
jgi:putative SOS response-associated peptidase YedK